MTGRYWTTPEVTTVRQHYPLGGIDACMPLLPGRTRSGVYQQAAKLGLHAPGVTHVREHWPQSDTVDAAIRRLHQAAPTRGGISALADQLKRPRWWVSKRARQLGFVTPRFSEPLWTEAEIELLHATSHVSTSNARLRFLASGFKRSESAIEVKRKRLGLHPSDNGVWNANQLAEMLGADRKTVTRWISQRELKAARRDDDKRYDIHESDLRAFIIACPFRVDLRKVPPPNQAWLIELLSGRGMATRERKAA